MDTTTFTNTIKTITEGMSLANVMDNYRSGDVLAFDSQEEHAAAMLAMAMWVGEMPYEHMVAIREYRDLMLSLGIETVGESYPDKFVALCNLGAQAILDIAAAQAHLN